MAKRHRYIAGFRILIVLIIPTMYFVFVSAVGLLSKGSENYPLEEENHFVGTRRLLQIDKNQSTSTSNCTPPSVEDFPPDGLTRKERQSGYIILHVVIAFYSFLLLAIVCDDFFVPSITKICEKLDIPKDVAGATFMAAASSSPELFINVVGTFVTEGDLGIGTIVGSAVFNILAVPACCGLIATQVLDLERWPITRDSLAYGITVLLLIVTLRDGRIEWYEAFLLVATYILYLMAMMFNGRINGCFKWLTKGRPKKYKLLETSPLLEKGIGAKKIENEIFFNNRNDIKAIFQNGTHNTIMDIDSLESFKSDTFANLNAWPVPLTEKIWWVVTWPINFILLITIPDCRKFSLRNWYPLTFLMCIAWIAMMSYVVGWDITIIGDTLMIPDSVMGLTFLAAGMSVPEAVSSVIVTNQGHGTMGISNSIGSNVFDVLLCLGLPWFIKASFLPSLPGQNYIRINSEGLIYCSVSLLSSLLILYVVLAFNSFKLDRKVGVICLTVYAIFLIVSSAIEMNVFFVVNRPTCEH